MLSEDKVNAIIEKVKKNQIYWTFKISKFLSPDGVETVTMSFKILPIKDFPIGLL